MKTIIRTLFGLILLTCASQWNAFAAFPIATNPAAIELGCGTAFGGSNCLALIISNNILNARLVATNGTLLGQQINIGGYLGYPPDAEVVFGQGNYLVAWSDTSVSSGVDMFGQFISSGGALAGPSFPLLASQGSYGFQELRALATDGTNFLAVWQDDNDGSFHGQFISASGTLSGAPFLISSMLDSGNSAAAVYGKTNYLVVWMSNNAVTDGQNNTYGALVSPNGNVGSAFQISGTVSSDANPLAAAFDGNNYNVIWPWDYSGGSSAPNFELFGRFVSQSGVPMGDIYTAAIAHSGQTMFPSLAFDGLHYLLSWGEFDFNPDQSFNPTNSNVYFRFCDTSGNGLGPEFTAYSADGANTPLLSINGLTFAGSGFVNTATLGTAEFSYGYFDGFDTGEVWGTFIPPASGGALAVTATPTNGNAPLSVQFTSSGMDSMGNNIIGWNWNFGDGTTSMLQNPAHTYSTPGNYTASVIATNNKGLLVINSGLSIAAWSPVPVFSPLYSFSGSDGDYANGFPAVSGNTIYDTSTYGGASFSGNLFKINIDGSGYEPLYNFSSAYPYSAPILSGNSLYGVGYQGGANGTGFIYKLNTDGTGYTNIYSFTPLGTNGFTNQDGAYPYAGLTLSGSTLYGTGSYAGLYGYGTIWKINTDGTGFNTLYNFRGLDDGSAPWSRMLLASNKLYGAASSTIYSLDTSSLNFSVLHAFSDTQGPLGTNNDGHQVISPLLLCDCTLYGTAIQGGYYGRGTIFSVNTDGSNFIVLHHFSALDINGQNPDGAESLSNGMYGGGCLSGSLGWTLFGTATFGGAYGSGTIFSLKRDGSIFQTVYDFSARDTNYDNPDGAEPTGMTLYNRTFFGTTYAGGPSSYGTIFSYFPAVPPTPPRLHIAPFGNNVSLSWSTSFSGYSLQYSTSIGPSAKWSPAPTPPTVVNGRYTVTNMITGQRMFFRLVL